MDICDDLIREAVPGRTFADVGGLWNISNEKVSVAFAAGAAAVTKIDDAPTGDELWSRLEERLVSLGVDNYSSIAGNVPALAARADFPGYDVVYCAGVLQHSPEPLYLIRSLRTITRRYLILTSAITQERVENDLGVFQLPASGIVFVPALPDHERKILAKYWIEHAGATAWGITEPISWDLRDLGAWWCLPTAHSMTAMARVCGLRLISSHPTWNGDAQTLFLEVV